MKATRKPVHGCYTCLLNLGDHCWLYKYPRGQWRGAKTCPARGNEEVYREFRTWQKQPDVKTLKDLRREFFRANVYAEIRKKRRRRRRKRS